MPTIYEHYANFKKKVLDIFLMRDKRYYERLRHFEEIFRKADEESPKSADEIEIIYTPREVIKALDLAKQKLALEQRLN